MFSTKRLALYDNKIELAKLGITIGSISNAIIAKSLEEDAMTNEQRIRVQFRRGAT